MTREFTGHELFLRGRELQFLIHSFLYYKMDESLIPDSQYDFICKTLFENKDMMCFRYPEIISKLDSSGSGYFIQRYPNEVITKGLHLLHFVKKRHGLKDDFETYINRYGYVVLKGGKI